MYHRDSWAWDDISVRSFSHIKESKTPIPTATCQQVARIKRKTAYAFTFLDMEQHKKDTDSWIWWFYQIYTIISISRVNYKYTLSSPSSNLENIAVLNSNILTKECTLSTAQHTNSVALCICTVRTTSRFCSSQSLQVVSVDIVQNCAKEGSSSKHLTSIKNWQLKFLFAWLYLCAQHGSLGVQEQEHPELKETFGQRLLSKDELSCPVKLDRKALENKFCTRNQSIWT